MSLEGMRRQEALPIFHIEHGAVQQVITEVLFGRMHKGATEANRNEVMEYWIEKNYAARWREYIDEHEGDRLTLSDENIERLCDEVFPETKETIH